MYNLTEIPGVTIKEGPQDWQILQRDKKGSAVTTIKGTWVTSEMKFYVQARVVDENTGMPVTNDLDWQDADVSMENKSFSITLFAIPQGGLYRIETRIKRPFASDRRAMRGDCIHHIGVGDIYVIAGQSNASGTGKGGISDGPVMGVHILGNNERWKIASHPIEDATDTLHPVTITGIFHGTSPWLSFGRRLLIKTGIPIGLIPAALGGSAISMWIDDENRPGVLFENMRDMIMKAGGKIAGILWYQGETDVIIGKLDGYESKLYTFIKLVRELVGVNNLPVFMAQLNSFLDGTCDENMSRMREMQRKISQSNKSIHMIVTIDCPLSDEIHNSSASNLIIGERFADAVLHHVFGYKIKSSYPEPEKVFFRDRDHRIFVILFRNISGDWTPCILDSEFEVSDAEGFIGIDSIKINEDNSILVHLKRNATGNTVLHALYGCKPRVSLKDDSGRCMTPFSVFISDAE